MPRWNPTSTRSQAASRCRSAGRWHASRPASRVAPSVLDDVAAALTSGEETVLFIGGDVMTADGQLAAAQVAAGTGARLLSETFPARATRAAGLPDVQK